MVVSYMHHDLSSVRESLFSRYVMCCTCRQRSSMTRFRGMFYASHRIIMGTLELRSLTCRCRSRSPATPSIGVIWRFSSSTTQLTGSALTIPSSKWWLVILRISYFPIGQSPVCVPIVGDPYHLRNGCVTLAHQRQFFVAYDLSERDCFRSFDQTILMHSLWLALLFSACYGWD
jgi:hypothetical protein